MHALRPTLAFAIAITTIWLPGPINADVTWDATEPARHGLNIGPVLREIRSLDDPWLTENINLLEEYYEGGGAVTDDNVSDHVNILLAYYDALQNTGHLLNWRIGMELNGALRAKSLGELETSEDIIATLPRRFEEMRRAHAMAGRTGEIRLVSPDRAEVYAKRHETVVLEYVVETPLEEGARIRFGQNWYGDTGRLQFHRPIDENFTTITAPGRDDVTFVAGARVWLGGAHTGLSGGNRPMIVLKDGRLEEGDRIRFVLGDTSEGSPGWLIQSFTNDALDLRIEMDFEGDGVFVPVAQPRLRVFGNDARDIRVVAPSVIRPGEAFTVKASVEDEYHNRAAAKLPRQLELYHGDTRLARTRSIKGDPATFHFEAITIETDEARPAYLEVRDRDGVLRGTSNPVVTRAGGPRLYWGELHGHEGYTDANGSPEWYMNYAKNVAFLDFASLTGHDIMLSEVHFRHNYLVTDAFNQPEDGFVAFRAYEWTNNWRYGGHHNVFLLDDTQRPITVMEAPRLEDMLALHRSDNDRNKVLVIPHAHQPGDWNIKGAELVEIMSQHGSFEWFGREYLMKGHKVGLHAASDDHIGHPGNAPSRGRSRGGIGAVFSPELEPRQILDHLKRRHTYGTTLARIYVETDVSGAPMGDTVEVEGPVRVDGFAAGTNEISNITLVVNGEETQTAVYDRPKPGSTTLRMRVTRDTRPANPNAPRTPSGDRRYWGRIFIHQPGDRIGWSEGSQSQTHITRVSPLGLESYADKFAQTGRHEATFTVNVRGDNDGLLLDLDDIDPDDLVTVLIMTSPAEDIEHWNMQKKPYLPGEYFNVDVPRREIMISETVRLGDLVDGSPAWTFDDHASVDLSMISTGNAKYQSFAFEVDEDVLKPGDNNHIYVRVQQLDDETAWSSPTFIDWRR